MKQYGIQETFGNLPQRQYSRVFQEIHKTPSALVKAGHTAALNKPLLHQISFNTLDVWICSRIRDGDVFLAVGCKLYGPI